MDDLFWYNVAFEVPLEGISGEVFESLEGVGSLGEVKRSLYDRDFEVRRSRSDLVRSINQCAMRHGGWVVEAPADFMRNLSLWLEFGTQEGRREFMDELQEEYVANPRNIRYFKLKDSYVGP